MNEAQIKSVALFFFYAFLDKNVALMATLYAITILEKRLKKKSDLDSVDPLVVYATFKAWKKFRKKKNIKSLSPDWFQENWTIPIGVDLGAWKQFVVSEDPRLMLAVIWVHLLGLRDKEISQGLGVSEGSVRYRAGQGLKRLGYYAAKKGDLRA